MTTSSTDKTYDYALWKDLVIGMYTKERFIDNMAENMPVLRKKLKLSQENLAEIIGVSRYTIMLIENKKRKMTWTMFLALFFVFERNEQTAVLLETFQISCKELDGIVLAG